MFCKNFSARFFFADLFFELIRTKNRDHFLLGGSLVACHYFRCWKVRACFSNVTCKRIVTNNFFVHLHLVRRTLGHQDDFVMCPD